MRVSYSVRSLLLSFLLLALASSEKDNPSAGLSSASEPVGAPPCGQNSNEKRLLTLAGGSDVRRNWQTQEPERRVHSGYTGKDARVIPFKSRRKSGGGGGGRTPRPTTLRHQ